MPTFSSLQIPPPANWQDFEILCCDLWRAIWNDPNTQRNGRQGQPQHGVDVYGRPTQKEWAGVQCKGKNTYISRFLTEKEVRTEIEKAKAFKPNLSQFIIATTGPKDARIEELAREITEEHLRKELFSVHIWAWPDIVARLADFPDLIEKHYPGLHVNIKELKKEIDTLKMARIRGTVTLPPSPRSRDALYSVYVAIRGLEQFAEEIAKKGIDKKTVRENLINVIRERVKTLEKGAIDYYGRGNWCLAAADLDEVFRSISEILDHNTGFTGYEKVPLEIGVGTAEYKGELDEVTASQKYDLKSFIVLTEAVYQQLEPLDKKMCTKIDCTEGKITWFTADVKKVLKRGKIFAFLEKIGYPGSKLYGRIDEVYIPPVEYGDIKKMLQKEGIVFITGTREYGKTYTAVRLMWEYYTKGYEPKWIKGGEEKERITARDKLEDIEAVLKPHHVIYFEDPFGKKTYEGKEGLERGIGTIIDSVKRLKDTYVIITSREEIFKEFEKQKLSKSDIRKYEKRLNLKRPSYDYEKRKEILAKWAENENCKWAKKRDLSKMVLETIRDERILPTPLSMRDFSKATVSVGTKGNLEEKMKEKSEETAMAFSREIKSMADDKVLFLLFLFISTRCDVDLLRTMYEALIGTLELGGAWEFERVLQWFKDDKVNISDYVEFSHPSYSEALKHLLVENGYATQINKEIFSKLLFNLAERDEIAADVAWTVAYNFDNLSGAMQGLLFSLCERDAIAKSVAWNIAHNFDNLSGAMQDLLFSLCERDAIAGDVAWTVAYNFGNLSGAVQGLLFNLCERDDVAGDVADAVVQNFDKLPSDVRNKLLLALSEKDGAAGIVADAVVQNFDKLPSDVRDDLLVRFSEKNETAATVAPAVVQNFDKLPDTVRNKLLLTICEKDEAAAPVADAVVQNFDKFPGAVRNKLLLTICEKDEAAATVARTVAQNFDKLPNTVRNDLLLNLSEKGEAAEGVARAVVQNFDKLPDTVKNRLLLTLSGNVRNNVLLTLAEKHRASADVAQVVVKNFSRFPRDVRHNLLLTLAEKDEASVIVAGFVVKTFDKFPEYVRNDLLLKLPHSVRNDLLLALSKKDRTSEAVARFIVKNFSKLPEHVRNDLLLALSEKERAVRYVARFVVKTFDKLPEHVRNTLLLTISEKDEAAKHVAQAVVKNFKKFPRDVRNKLLLNLPDTTRNDLLVTLSEKDEAAAAAAGFVVKTFDKLPEDVRNDLLLTLSEKDRASGVIAGFVVKTFDNLPDTTRNDLLVTLSEKDEAAAAVAGFVTHNFSTFPRDVGNNLLLNLSEKDETARDAVKIIAKNFDKLPSKVRNKRLLSLSEKDEAASNVVKIVSENFNRVPGNTRNRILLNLSEKDEAASDVVKIIAENFDKLPGSIRKKLSRTLSQKDEAVKVATTFIIKDYHKLPEDVRLFLFNLSNK